MPAKHTLQVSCLPSSPQIQLNNFVFKFTPDFKTRKTTFLKPHFYKDIWKEAQDVGKRRTKCVGSGREKDLRKRKEREGFIDKGPHNFNMALNEIIKESIRDTLIIGSIAEKAREIARYKTRGGVRDKTMEFIVDYGSAFIMAENLVFIGYNYIHNKELTYPTVIFSGIAIGRFPFSTLTNKVLSDCKRT